MEYIFFWCIYLCFTAHAIEGQVNELRDLQDQHEREKKLWALSVNQLNDKIKVSGVVFCLKKHACTHDKLYGDLHLNYLWGGWQVLKSEYTKVFEEAKCYASALPDISEMTSSVQALGEYWNVCTTVQLSYDSDILLISIFFAVNEHDELKVQYSELKAKFVEESKERKQLYNKILELKGKFIISRFMLAVYKLNP